MQHVAYTVHTILSRVSTLRVVDALYLISKQALDLLVPEIELIFGFSAYLGYFNYEIFLLSYCKS
jgi:hypothetical protein